MPHCTGCRAFGHVREDRARTYANIIGTSPTADDSHENNMDAGEVETAATITKDGSPQRGPSGKPECCGSSPTELEVTDEEMTEDQNAVQKQEIDDDHGSDLSGNSAVLTKRPRAVTTL
ncbi:hypothetical protein MRX96_007171 [Rhipicephalus microplus]